MSTTVKSAVVRSKKHGKETVRNPIAYVRDLDACRNNMIRSNFREIIKNHGLTLAHAQELLYDAFHDKFQKPVINQVEETICPKCNINKVASVTKRFCETCAQERKCLDCGKRVMPTSFRCGACVLAKKNN